MSSAGIGFAKAVQAYSNAATGEHMGAQERASQINDNNEQFSSLVRQAIDEAVKIGERSEQLSIAGVNDRADLNQVVTAVAEAEVTLQTVVAVRDRVIEAYREILRMPI